MRSPIRLTFLIVLASSSWSWGQDQGIDASEAQDEQVRRIIEERKHREELLARQPTSLDGGATVNPLVLEPILDNTHGLRFEERDAYFRMLELAWQTPLSEQEQFARELREDRRQANPRYAKRKPEQFPILADMVNNPDEYRGRPVSIHGVLRKLTKFDPGKNSRNIGDVYEGWIYTDDSRARTPDNEDIVIPTVVIFQGKPDGLDVGGDLTEEVRVTGYFFKLYRYDAQDRGWKAPLLIAGAVEWREHKPPTPPALGPEVYLLVTMVALVLAFVWWQSNRREMASAIHPREADFTQFPPSEIPSTTQAPNVTNLTEPHDS